MSDLVNGAPYRFTAEGEYLGFRDSEAKKGDGLGYASILIGGIAQISFRCEEGLFLAAGVKPGDVCIVEGRLTQRTFQGNLVTESHPMAVRRWPTLERAAASGAAKPTKCLLRNA